MPMRNAGIGPPVAPIPAEAYAWRSRRAARKARSIISRSTSRLEISGTAADRSSLAESFFLWPARQAAAIGDDLPMHRIFLQQRLQQLLDVANAWLPEPMIGHKRPNRRQVEPHGCEHAKQRWLQHGSPMRDAVRSAELQENLHQAEAGQPASLVFVRAE